MQRGLPVIKVLIETDHIGLISDRQMHAKGGAEADKSEQSSGSSGEKAHQEHQAPEQMDGHGLQLSDVEQT